MEARAACSGVRSRIASITFAFSARTASALNELGASIAVIARSWNMWLGTMSRKAPACS